jgi:hypothetical protein
MGGKLTNVPLLAAADFSYALREEEQPYLRLAEPEFAYAPVASGQEAGCAYVCIGDTAVGKIPLIYGETVEQEVLPKKHFWQRWFGGKKNDGALAKNTCITGAMLPT